MGDIFIISHRSACEGDQPMWSWSKDQLQKYTYYFVPPLCIDGQKLSKFYIVVGDKGKNTLNWRWWGSLDDHVGALPRRIALATARLGQPLRGNAPMWSVSTYPPSASCQVFLPYAWAQYTVIYTLIDAQQWEQPKSNTDCFTNVSDKVMTSGNVSLLPWYHFGNSSRVFWQNLRYEQVISTTASLLSLDNRGIPFQSATPTMSSENFHHCTANKFILPRFLDYFQQWMLRGMVGILREQKNLSCAHPWWGRGMKRHNHMLKWLQAIKHNFIQYTNISTSCKPLANITNMLDKQDTDMQGSDDMLQHVSCRLEFTLTHNTYTASRTTCLQCWMIQHFTDSGIRENTSHS